MPYGLNGKEPPRSIQPGDVVAHFSEELGEWTAAQLTDLNDSWKTVGVLEFAWSGPEPASLGDIDPTPLILSHHAWANQISHTNYPWVLPRSFKVIGRLPLMRTDRSNSYSTGWNVGRQLAAQRRWDRGEQDSPYVWPGELKLKGRQLEPYLAAQTPHEIWSLTVDDTEHLDCERLVDSFPKIRRLVLHGRLGRLDNAIRLNDLSSLKTLAISDLFGMTSEDCLLPSSTPDLEWLALHSIPRDYGDAMRSVWAKEVARGCLADFSALRALDWLAANLDNPLRDWDGREHISAAKFRKAVAQYKATRRAVLEAMSQSSGQELKARMTAVGREYGEAFNTLARRDNFIETVERDELFEALTAIPKGARVADSEAQELADWLAEGLEQVRDW